MEDSGDTDSPVISTISKVLGFLLFCLAWFFLGGIFSIGQFLTHNAENVVGKFFHYAPAATWLILPLSFLFLLVSENKWTVRLFFGNLLIWLALIVAVFIRSGFA